MFRGFMLGIISVIGILAVPFIGWVIVPMLPLFVLIPLTMMLASLTFSYILNKIDLLLFMDRILFSDRYSFSSFVRKMLKGLRLYEIREMTLRQSKIAPPSSRPA